MKLEEKIGELLKSKNLSLSTEKVVQEAVLQLW